MSKFRIETRDVVVTTKKKVAVMEFDEEQLRLLRIVIGGVDGHNLLALCQRSQFNKTGDGLNPSGGPSSMQLQPLFDAFMHAHEAVQDKE